MPANTPNIPVTMQSIVVPMLQKYLTFNKINIAVDTGGICAGLAAVYCKYAIEDKEQEFLDMLELICEKGAAIENNTFSTEKNEDTDKLNGFIFQTLAAFLPQNFDPTLSQDDNGKNVKIEVEDPITKVKETKPLALKYNIALAVSRGSWENIFKRFKDIDSCPMTISSPIHSIAVCKKNGEFRVYDPSHNQLDICSNEKELVNLLSQIFSQEGKAASILPLAVNVYSHPIKEINATFISKGQIIKNLVSHANDLNQSVKIDGYNFDSLAMATLQNDIELINLLLDNGASNTDVALQLAARDNRMDALELLLTPENRKYLKNPEETKLNACRLVCHFGRYQAFQSLINDKETNTHFLKALEDINYQKEILALVVKSSSSLCLEALINYYESNINGLNLPVLIDSKIIELAQKKGNQKCLNLLNDKSGQMIPNLSENKIDVISQPETVEETNSFIAGLRLFTEFLSYLYIAITLKLSTLNPFNFFKSQRTEEYSPILSEQPKVN